MKTFFKIFILLFLNNIYAQEFIADVQVDFSQVQTSNNQVFKTLENSLKSFINNTKWTNKTYKSHEKINCTFAIIVNSRPTNDRFKASLVVESKRPVYNSTYSTPILNINDKDFEFNYVEYENLIVNERRFSGKNLTDVIAYYIYLILGYDSDSFALNGGDEYFKKVKLIADNSQNQNFPGWNSIDGYKTKSSLIQDILKPQNSNLRVASYNYHRLGLDMISTNEQNSKNQIASSILQLSTFENTTQFYSLDIFIMAKKQELVDIFSGGIYKPTNLQKMKELLNTISPINIQDYWNKIKN